MTTAQLIVLDHVAVLLTAATWIAAGATAAVRRTTLALALLGGAVLTTLARGATAAALAGQGWWFAQEKVLLGLPLLAVGAAAALVLAAPPLLAARRNPGAKIPAAAVAALFTAGFAAVAGLAVTFLAGYPLTWSTALIAVSFVAGSALLTRRAVAPPAVRRESGDDVSRRRFLRLAGTTAVAGAGATGIGLVFAPGESVAAGGGHGRAVHPGRSVSVADLRGPRSPASGGEVRRYEVIARKAVVRLPSGSDVEAWTYDGQLPGTPITATEGDLLEVTLRNADIDDGVTLHWHGYDVPCGEDGAPGVTQEVVREGAEFVYRFRADRVGTYWYHTHQASHRGVRRGLYGTLVVSPRDADTDPEGLDLTLPLHTLAGVSLLGVHDTLTDQPATPGAPVRLRLINTDSDPHRLALAGTPFRVAAVDGQDLNEPTDVEGSALRLPAGGRYDLTFVMPDGPVMLIAGAGDDSGLRLIPEGTEPGPLPDTDGPPETANWPELDLLTYGSPAPVPFDAGSSYDRHFTMVLDRGVAMVDGTPAYAQTVNGRGHPEIPEQLVSAGDLVRFTVVNRSLETHPWHLHGHRMLILSRDDQRSTGSPLWVDTFDVRPGEVWDVAFEATNPGVWMNHCHNLPHADEGMMLRLSYDGVATPYGSHDAGDAMPAGGVSHGH